MAETAPAVRRTASTAARTAHPVVPGMTAAPRDSLHPSSQDESTRFAMSCGTGAAGPTVVVAKGMPAYTDSGNGMHLPAGGLG